MPKGKEGERKGRDDARGGRLEHLLGVERAEWRSKTGALNLLIREHFLASLPSCDPVLLRLARLRRRQLLLLLRLVDLVAHGIVGVLLLTILLVNPRAGALAFNPVVPRRLEVTVPHRPHFLTDALGEVLVVRDDQHTTLELLERLNERSEGLSVEVVGRARRDR